ncbi:MAG: DNA mismatch repair endonuclease MutL, partial [Phycisphaerales bacterium]|nr:DNA mismatch repair endonuclease MutL [Phycisphaerales bacterium]
MRVPAPPTDMPEIRVLPPLVVNQIAAGEVVERPASVVKELVDNAIDAHARHITVEIEAGGIELIRVTDDGRGVPGPQVPLAVHPHATSKVRDAADLERIATMGFRGEALASIASVARLSFRSRTADADGACRIDVDGGDASDVRPDAGPRGTSVTVRNLFFNTPARRKFLRTANTERGHCTDVVRDLAMAHPARGFTIRVDGRTVLELPPDQSPRDRITAILGDHVGEWFTIEADRFDEAAAPITLWGLIAPPAQARPTPKWQHVFLNGRPIRDKTVTHALREAYRGLIEPGKHPAAVVLLEVPPDAVDVNVHPAKAEVRFRDQGIIHKVVYHAARSVLLGSDLTPVSGHGAGPRFDAVRPAGAPEEAAAEVRTRFTNYLERFAPSQSQAGFDYASLKAAVDAERDAIAAERAAIEEARADLESKHHRAARTPDAPGQEQMTAATPAARVLQVHNSYLVTQDEQGLLIIDQHALHERVMFEKLRARLSSGPLESQRLLVPDVLETTPQRVDLLEALAGVLARLGIAAEPLGPASIGIHAFPTFLFDRKVEPRGFLADLLERTESQPAAVGDEEALHEIVDMMACKAA